VWPAVRALLLPTSPSSITPSASTSWRDSHPNIEEFWSIIKRGVVGTFQKTSRKYMRLYAEFQLQ
jgi:hypothetical protein